MTSWVELGNLALSKLGHIEYITSLTDESKAAILINKNYLQVRDFLLRAHKWNFAVKRVQLAPDVTEPAWGDGNYFTLPTDWIRTIGVGDLEEYNPFTQEDGKILFDSTVCNLIYICRVEDPNKFDSHFVETYTTRLAYNISMGLAVDKNLRNDLLQMYQADIRKAAAVDGFERGVQTMVANDFLNHRA